jgi:aspartate/methionine/tyrosine aminotransferase
LVGYPRATGCPDGWLALQNAALQDRVQGWKDYTSICSSAPSEALAQIALEIRDLLAERSRRIIREHLALAEPFFARWQTVFRWNRPLAGSVALAGLHHGSAREFCQRLVRRQGVLLLPSLGLGLGDGHVRFGFGRLNFPAALAQLEDYLAQQGASTPAPT